MILVMESNLHKKIGVSKMGSDVPAQGHMVIELEPELLYPGSR